MTLQPGLREKRKRETREALSQAAIAIVVREGIEALTAARVADEANVSRRTFFNYFPRVEDVLTATIEHVTSDTVAAFVARPADEPLRVSIDAVLDMVLDSAAFEQAQVLEQAALESPATRRYLREFTESQAMAFEAGLRERIGPDADPLYVAAMAASVAAVLTAATRVSVRDGLDTDGFRSHVRRALEHLFSGFDESHARRPDHKDA